MLHECGVDLGAECDPYQNTPAKWAVCEDMQQSLKTLYLCEVDLTAPCDEYEHTPKELAALEDNEEVDELLDAMLLPDDLKPWICEQCGLENQAHLTTCSVCGVKRAKDPRRVLVPH